MHRDSNNLITSHIHNVIIEPFTSKGIEFIVVGGLAVRWYCPTRQPDDMDLLVNNTMDNSKKVVDILNGINKLENLERDFFAKPGKRLHIKEYPKADIMTRHPSELTFEELTKGAITRKPTLNGFAVKIPSVENLIRMKETAILSTGQDPNKNEQQKEKEIKKHKQDIELLRETDKTT